jgi:hypothetical protein
LLEHGKFSLTNQQALKCVFLFSHYKLHSYSWPAMPPPSIESHRLRFVSTPLIIKIIVIILQARDDLPSLDVRDEDFMEDRLVARGPSGMRHKLGVYRLHLWWGTLLNRSFYCRGRSTNNRLPSTASESLYPDTYECCQYS